MCDKIAFERELERLINELAMEDGSDTPDFILAAYLLDCLDAFERATRLRGRWYGRRSSEPLNCGTGDSTPPTHHNTCHTKKAEP